MGVTVDVELCQVHHRFGRTAGRDFARPDETPETLNDLHVDKVRRVEFVVVAKETGLDPHAKRRLQEKLQ